MSILTNESAIAYTKGVFAEYPNAESFKVTKAQNGDEPDCATIDVHFEYDGGAGFMTVWIENYNNVPALYGEW